MPPNKTPLFGQNARIAASEKLWVSDTELFIAGGKGMAV